MKRINPFWRSTLASFCIGGWDMPFPLGQVRIRLRLQIQTADLNLQSAISNHLPPCDDASFSAPAPCCNGSVPGAWAERYKAKTLQVGNRNHLSSAGRAATAVDRLGNIKYLSAPRCGFSCWHARRQ